MIGTPMPAAVWNYTNESISGLKYGLRFCRELERGELSQPALNVLKKYSKPGPIDILYALGRGSGCTREPAQNNYHAGLTRLLGELSESIESQIWDKLSVDDCPDDWLKSFTAGELAAIAVEFRSRIAAITPKELKDEAEAAGLWIEGQNSGSGKRGTKTTGTRKRGSKSASTRITLADRALIKLQNDVSIAASANPIAELAARLGCDKRSLQPDRAPALHRALNAVAITDRETATSHQQFDADLHNVRARKR